MEKLLKILESIKPGVDFKNSKNMIEEVLKISILFFSVCRHTPITVLLNAI